MNRMPPSTRLLITSGHTSFYTTAGQVRLGVGIQSAFNASCQCALDALEFQQQLEPWLMGISGTWSGIEVQVAVYCKDIDKTP